MSNKSTDCWQDVNFMGLAMWPSVNKKGNYIIERAKWFSELVEIKKEEKKLMQRKENFIKKYLTKNQNQSTLAIKGE